MFDSDILIAVQTPDLVDEVSSTLYYLGWTDIGISATSEAKFRVARMQKTGNVWQKMWANGSRRYDQVWDDRADGAKITYTFRK
jgi:hypothetical protein